MVSFVVYDPIVFDALTKWVYNGRANRPYLSNKLEATVSDPIQDQIDLERGGDSYWEDVMTDRENDYWENVMTDREDEYPEEDLGEAIRVFFACSVRTDSDVWYLFKTIFTEELEMETAAAQKEHDLVCNCGKPISVSTTD